MGVRRGVNDSACRALAAIWSQRAAARRSRLRTRPIQPADMRVLGG